MFFLIAAFLVLGSPLAPLPEARGDTPSRANVLVEGEELTYNVRYGFFYLGQVRIKVLKKVAAPADCAYQSKAYIDSYPKLPFVDLHATF